jgi:hypothetical protein
MKKNKENRGGTREGAGCKSKHRTAANFRLDPEILARIKQEVKQSDKVNEALRMLFASENDPMVYDINEWWRRVNKLVGSYGLTAYYTAAHIQHVKLKSGRTVMGYFVTSAAIDLVEVCKETPGEALQEFERLIQANGYALKSAL